MKERGHILNTLKEVKQALNRKNNVKIKQLSNHIVHHSSIHQDPDIISLAVIIYALSKLIERKDYRKQKNWTNFYRNYIRGIDNLIKYLQKDDIQRFREEISKIRGSIKKLSGDLKVYMQDVFRRAQINKASRLYEHGISMEKTAKILGVTIWELSEYAGQTRIGDVNLGITVPIRTRIRYAEEMFRK